MNEQLMGFAMFSDDVAIDCELIEAAMRDMSEAGITVHEVEIIDFKQGWRVAY